MPEKISWRQKINPIWWFGNIDDPEPPDWFEPTQLNYERRRGWRFRNPFHNFFWYVLGIADKEFTAHGKATENVFVDGLNYTFLKTKHLPVCFPFISYRGLGIKFYVGWRPDSGAFGLKLTIDRR
ncbi:MAG: hypothetical protein GXP46_01905 [Deferribacteres bacterium]|nr:hypothetical protein [Deferribacteres bacterium]